MIVVFVGGYLIVAAIFGSLVALAVDRAFRPPLDLLDCLFIGFMGLLWPIVLPFVSVGWCAHRIQRRLWP